MDTFSQKQTLFNYFSEMQIHKREGEETDLGGGHGEKIKVKERKRDRPRKAGEAEKQSHSSLARNQFLISRVKFARKL